MARIFGRRCSLTLVLDGAPPVALPYSEETVREAVRGHFLPPAFGGRKMGRFVADGTEIAGCFITRLDDECAEPLLFLAGSPRRRFSLVQRQGGICKKYEGLFLCAFSLFAEHGGAFYFKGEVAGDTESRAGACGAGEALLWERRGTFFFDGRSAVQDGNAMPLVHRMELKGSLVRDAECELLLYSALGDRFVPTLDLVDAVKITLCKKKGLSLTAGGLVLLHDLSDINCIFYRAFPSLRSGRAFRGSAVAPLLHSLRSFRNGCRRPSNP